MARKKEQANTEKKVERPGKPARGSRRMHPAGPHARPELTDEAATPGTGALPDANPDTRDVDPGVD
ncbi:MAG: hypothetical protein DIU57_008070 [Pseudomonadota bacterium]|mgnify:CR=1 FL=1|nr:MAG: hypothetical protein DIU57_05660 [Pseudomonadota bacterium]HEX5600070.1 hypothetical protein [Hyphomicrobiaceae bacterium]